MKELSDQAILEKARIWTRPPFDQATREEIQALIDAGDIEELRDRFYKQLAFGTGGMRGIMGAGTNRINKYTLGKNTQGLSNYLLKRLPGKVIKVVVAYDCRHNSRSFAAAVADVFSANGIQVYLFDDLRPTPELSFAVRHLGCDAGVVLTASHNPPEYNGYKVYLDDGAQIVPPADGEIVDEIRALSFEDIRFDANRNLIKTIGEEVDGAFVEVSVAHGSFAEVNGRDRLRIVFTPLHGTSIKLLPRVLERAGYTDVHIVEAQATPDGSFPTVKSPNPEEPAAMQMAVAMANRIDADIVLGTDPDSDRIAIGVRNLRGDMVLLNGNQTMVLMTEFLLARWKAAGRLTGGEFVASTIVSTDMIKKIADAYGVELKVGLTGFKWIAKMIREAEGKQAFVGGGEESFGYLVGDFVRDKDAVTSGLLACEIATWAKSKGSSIYEWLLELYGKYGYYKEFLVSLVRKGIAGEREIREMMERLRHHPPVRLLDSDVVRICDLQQGSCRDIRSGEVRPSGMPQSNVLVFYTEAGDKIAVRPSGTEPKIKFYYSTHVDTGAGPFDAESVARIEERLQGRFDELRDELGIS